MNPRKGKISRREVLFTEEKMKYILRVLIVLMLNVCVIAAVRLLPAYII
jgi:hypothetical protein